MTSNDRRNAKRISFICEVEWEGAGMSRVNTRINDLSTTGAFIDSMTCFAVGATLNMKFRVRDTVIETRAEVRNSMPQVGMGVRFVDMKPEDVALLESLIEGKPLSAAPPATGPLQMPQKPGQRRTLVRSVLSGNFAVVSLFDVIQMIENSRLTGALSIDLPGTKGAIYFNDGQIVSARADASSDAEALTIFLGANQGTFEFQKSEVEFECSIRASTNTGLLLDLLRAKDEEDAFSMDAE